MRSAVALLSLALVACTAWQSDSVSGQRERVTVPERDKRAQAPEQPVTLGKLETRAHEITIRSGAPGAGPTFTVVSLEHGRTRKDVDAATFARDFPELFRDYETAFASVGTPGATIESSVGKPAETIDASRTIVIDAGL